MLFQSLPHSAASILLANMLLLLHFLPKTTPRVETLFDPSKGAPKSMDMKPAP